MISQRIGSSHILVQSICINYTFYYLFCSSALIFSCGDSSYLCVGPLLPIFFNYLFPFHILKFFPLYFLYFAVSLFPSSIYFIMLSVTFIYHFVSSRLIFNIKIHISVIFNLFLHIISLFKFFILKTIPNLWIFEF